MCVGRAAFCKRQVPFESYKNCYSSQNRRYKTQNKEGKNSQNGNKIRFLDRIRSDDSDRDSNVDDGKSDNFEAGNLIYSFYHK